MLLAAGLAAGEVGAEAGEVGVGVGASQLQLDVAVSSAKQSSQPTSGSSGPGSPDAARWARSLRRASWIVL